MINDISNLLYVHGPDLLASAAVFAVFLPLYVLFNVFVIAGYRLARHGNQDI